MLSIYLTMMLHTPFLLLINYYNWSINLKKKIFNLNILLASECICVFRTDKLIPEVNRMDFEYSDWYRKFGLNVAYYRKDRHFTQEGLAEKIDADRTTIGKIENALVGCSLDMVFRISDALEIEPYKLLEFRD